MNGRERYIETLLFGGPDRVPLSPGNGRKSTREAWYAQGLPRDVQNIAEYAYRRAGGLREWPDRGEDFDVNERMIPQFEERVIEERGATRVVQDWKGNVCEISSEFTTEYLRNAIDFVTRRWIKCPVETDADWADMKRRYDAGDPARLPADAPERAARLSGRETALTFHFSGPFWQLREWMGFEGLCMAFYDNPRLVREMIAFWDGHVARLMENAFRYVVPDEVYLSEDMAYKGFSMISPAMVREFILPTYKHWGDGLRRAGVPIYSVDSDGFIGELIPIWLEAGVNCCDPIEVAAGNDINAFRREFGRAMAYRGGVDKRAMAKGGRVIEAEIERIRPVIDDGGFIPSCDHGVPSDVAWPDYVYYTELLAKATGWM